MTPFLIFVAACLAIVAVGWIIRKRTGAHAWYVDGWQFNEGETILWRDDRAEVGMIPKLGQAVVMTPVRLHRWTVIVTNQRVILANKTFTGKKMVQSVLYPGTAPDDQSKHIGGGLLTRGYATLVIEPGVMHSHLDAGTRFPYVALTPLASEPSSLNLSEIRIYTDDGASFRLM